MGSGVRHASRDKAGSQPAADCQSAPRRSPKALYYDVQLRVLGCACTKLSIYLEALVRIL
jgi:hypothetical protein